MMPPFGVRSRSSLTNGFLEVLELYPHRDRGPAVLTLLVGAGAVAGVVSADLPPAWTFTSLAVVVGVVGLSLHDALRGSRLTRAVLLPDGRWNLFQDSTSPVPARLLYAWGAEFGPVIALQWRCEDGALVSAWLLSGELPSVTRRRLRARLRLA
jgi:hypothetical protein